MNVVILKEDLQTVFNISQAEVVELLLTTFPQIRILLELQVGDINYGHDDFSIRLLKDTTPHLKVS